MKKRNKQSGFSLIELLVVISILLIISAIAIPKMLAARASAVEANAASTMRSLNTALTQSLIKWNAFPATDLSVLGGDCSTTPASVSAECLLDDTISKALKTGTYNNYTWTYTPTTSGFTLTAVPLASATGVTRQFWLSESGTIHYSDDKNTPPDSTTPVLGN